MPEWIYLLSDDTIIVLVTMIVVGLTVAGLCIGRFLLRVRLGRDTADSLSNAYRLIVTLAALVLAFSLVQAQTNLRDAQSTLRREASAIDAADRKLRQIGTPAAAVLRAHLLAYGHAVLQDEWPIMAQQGFDRNVDDLYDTLLHASQVAVSQAPSAEQSAYAEAIREINTLDDYRDARVTAATVRLPRAFWRVIEALVLFSIVIAATIPWTVPHTISTILTSAALAVLVALTIIVDVPFEGETAAQPIELRYVLGQMAQRH